jgi:AraC-like DNA-binding protein
MENFAFIFVSTALIMGCISMALVFLTLPLPPIKALRKYRLSLRFLAGAYLSMAAIRFLLTAFDLTLVNLVSMEVLLISSLQAPLFAFSLIILINPSFITWSYLFRHLMPTFTFLVLYVLVALKWGNPQITSLGILKLLVLYPPVLVREVFLGYYIFQLVFLWRLFCVHAKEYEEKLDNYFADHLRLHLPGIRFSFYALLVVAALALLSCFMFTELLVFIFSLSFTVFYMVFGIYFIQYPRKFVNIQQIIYPSTVNTEKPAKNASHFDWAELKSQIIDDKYYLQPGVNIEEMAQYLKIGRTTLSNFINNVEGVNFNMWINSLRVEEAKLLLVEYPDCNLSEIAEQVGYSESSNFSRQFKLITAHSPSVWRQKQLN